MTMVYQLDIIILRWLNSWTGASIFFDWAIIFRATYLFYALVAALLLFTGLTFLPRFRAYRRKNFELVIFALISAIIARFGVTELIRFFYNRPRPFEALEGVHQLVNQAGGGSFPSGHAAFSFALAAAVAFYYPKTSVLFFLAAFSMGMGRIAAGVHWPSDILGGAIVGVLTALALQYILKKKILLKFHFNRIHFNRIKTPM